MKLNEERVLRLARRLTAEQRTRGAGLGDFIKRLGLMGPRHKEFAKRLAWLQDKASDVGAIALDYANIGDFKVPVHSPSELTSRLTARGARKSLETLADHLRRIGEGAKAALVEQAVDHLEWVYQEAPDMPGGHAREKKMRELVSMLFYVPVFEKVVAERQEHRSVKRAHSVVNVNEKTVRLAQVLFDEEQTESGN